MKNNCEIFTPFTFSNGVITKNKIVMAPMTSWSSNEDGTVAEDELAYYRSRVKGVGMVITGCTRVLENGQGFTGEFAAFDDRFIPSLKRMAEAAKSGGAPAILQIYHAGNKAVADLIPNRDVVGPSAVAPDISVFVEGSTPPRPLSSVEIDGLIDAFGQTTRRAIEAGFDGVEIHGAHGFLIQNFLSPHFNTRTDKWGGSLENRMRFPLAVVAEVSRTIEAHANKPFLLGYRFSPEEPQQDGLKISETLTLIDRLAEGKVDYVHASLYSVIDARPAGANEGTTIAQMVIDRVNGRVPVFAAGQIRSAQDARRALDMGLSSVVIGQALIMNPDWVEKAEKGISLASSLKRSQYPALSIPRKLSTAIESAKGWFVVED